jgi:DNA-binding GntR family transcriptional regulator
MAQSIWQFRGVGTEIEALVLAGDYERARELFQAHLRVHGGDPDTLLFRELEMHHLEEHAEVAVREALVTDRDGLVMHDDNRGWLFIIPLSDPSRQDVT